MIPESTIASWQNWQVKPPCRPEIIGPLGGGLSNRSYLISAGHSQYVLRINAPESTLPGIDREREATIWRAASSAGIAPRLLHAEAQFLVSDYVDNGEPIAASPSKVRVSKAIGLLEKCHSLKVDVPGLDYAAHIQLYWDLIEKKAAQVDESLIQQQQPMQACLDALLSSQNKSVLCHHDPVAANFVGPAQRLFLIDWEYASLGLPAMDYAAFAVEWGVDDQTVHKHSGIQTHELSQAKMLYKYMCQLWATAQSCQ